MEKLNWINAYTGKILEGITYSPYRKREEAELTEHITESYKNLMQVVLSWVSYRVAII